MCCSGPPKPPDLTATAEASEEVARINQQTAREQLEWAREQDTMNRDLLNQVLDIQLPAMEEQFRTAQADRTRYEEIYRPLEEQFREEAWSYDTPERRQQERAKAQADVATQFDSARKNALQRLEQYGGVDPTVTRNAALDVDVRTKQAAAAVGAMSQSDKRVEDTGRALRSDVVNMGRGALSNAAGFYGAAVGAGSQAQNNALNTTASGANAVQSSLGFSNAALSGYGQTANIYSQGFQNQMTAWNAQQEQTAGMLQGIGSIAGMAMGVKDGGPIDERAIPYTDEGEVVNTGLGDGSGIDDTVPAYLSDGEYVIPADVVRAKGEEFFDKLLERYHTPAAEQESANG